MAKIDEIEANQLLFMEFVECKERARKELFVSLEKERLRLLLQLGRMDTKIQEKYDEVKKLKDELKIVSDKKDSDFVWITISPRSDVSFLSFQSVVLRILKKKWMTHYLYVYEQRGKEINEIGKLPHLHMLLRRNGKKFSEVKRELLRAIESIVDLDVYSAYDIRLVKDDDDNVMRLMNYILGKKKDEEKQIKQYIDDEWRKRENLEKYYSLNFDEFIKNYFLRYNIEYAEIPK